MKFSKFNTCDEVINAIPFLQHAIHCLHQVIVDGAADTAIGQLHYVLFKSGGVDGVME